MSEFVNYDGLKGGVYLLRVGPRRYYVGVTKDFQSRRHSHLRRLRRGSHNNPVLQASYNKHCEDSVRFDPLVWCDRETAAKVEAWLIQSNISDENCANLRIEDGTTFTFSEETRRKMSESLRGRTCSEEHCRKLSEAHRGKPKSEEHRRKLGEAHRGKTLSEETRRRIGEALRGKPKSEEHRRRIGEATKNMSPEHRRKISEAKKGAKHTEETRRKISEAAKRREAARRAAKENPGEVAQ